MSPQKNRVISGKRLRRRGLHVVQLLAVHLRKPIRYQLLKIRVGERRLIGEPALQQKRVPLLRDHGLSRLLGISGQKLSAPHIAVGPQPAILSGPGTFWMYSRAYRGSPNRKLYTSSFRTVSHVFRPAGKLASTSASTRRGLDGGTPEPNRPQNTGGSRRCRVSLLYRPILRTRDAGASAAHSYVVPDLGGAPLGGAP
jgi:hypothetical protein